MDDDPVDPIGTPLKAALSLHELFLACQRAGFTEEQAFELVKAIALGGTEGSK